MKKTKKGIKKWNIGKSENWKIGKSENSPIEKMKKGCRKKGTSEIQNWKYIEILLIKSEKYNKYKKKLKNESI